MLGKGGDAVVFVHVARSHFTVKGSIFCGRSASHVVFEKILKPLLENRISIKNEVKEEQMSAAIIDLTEEPDINEEYAESMVMKTDHMHGQLIDLTEEETIEALVRDEVVTRRIMEENIVKIESKPEIPVKSECSPPSRTASMATPLVLSKELSSLLGTGTGLLSRIQVRLVTIVIDNPSPYTARYSKFIKKFPVSVDTKFLSNYHR